MSIRPVTPADAARLAAIYRPYVESTAITFEYVPPTPEQMEARIRTLTKAWPWLVWEEEGRVLGYAFAAPAFEKTAYAWCADVTIYLSQEARGRGLGKILYTALERQLQAGGWQILYALVTRSNQASMAFHASMGYRQVGLLARSGWKLGRWHDVCWLEKRIGDEAPTRPPVCLPVSPGDGDCC